MNVNKFFCIFSALCIALLINCKSYDYHPDLLVGTTFKHKTEKQDIVVMMNRLENTPIIKSVETSYNEEIFFIKGWFGRFIGQANEFTGNLDAIFEKYIKDIKVEKGQKIVIHNLQIINNTNFILEAYNVFGTPFSYTLYKIKFDVSSVSNESLDSMFLKKIKK